MVTQSGISSAERVDVADVILWGKNIAAVAWDHQRSVAHFEYTPAFQKSSIQPSPVMMPLSNKIYSFSGLSTQTYYGLPGLLADSLPDKFGHALINAWLATQGRSQSTFSPIERLCYVGQRGMGALEFRPSLDRYSSTSHAIQVDSLVELANDVLTQREGLITSLEHDESKQKAFEDIIRVGTSAGGARAKAVIAWNRQTNEVRSGQVNAPEGFTYWILKFDGVSNNKDKELADPKGFGRVEYAYYLMAKAAGITMMDSELLEENGRAHFVTKRFDRFDNGEKLHCQTLCAIAHLDFNQAGAHSYEQAFQVMRQLNVSHEEVIEQYRRMVFNVVTRNQDDHTKNISYVMNKKGEWRLSPAYDICFAYNPDGLWTHQHQMSIHGKRDHFDVTDLLSVASQVGIRSDKAKGIIQQVVDSAQQWSSFAKESGVDEAFASYIGQCHRLLKE